MTVEAAGAHETNSDSYGGRINIMSPSHYPYSRDSDHSKIPHWLSYKYIGSVPKRYYISNFHLIHDFRALGWPELLY